MAARVETVFSASTRDIERKLGQLDQRIDRFARRTATSAQSVSKDIKHIDQSVVGLSRSLKGAAGLLAAAFSTREVIALADTFTTFQSKLINANVAAKDMAATQERLFAIAKANGSEIVSIGELYGSLATATSDLNTSQADLITITEGVAAALKVSGAGAAQASSVILQLSQAIAGGKLQAQEYNSIIDASPALMQGLAREIPGVEGSLGKLRQAMLDGKLTVDVLVPALTRMSDEMVNKAAKAPQTTAMAFQNLQTAMVQYVGQADQSLGATAAMTSAINMLADNLDDVANVAMVGLAIAAARTTGAMAAFTASKVAAGVASVRLAAFQATMTASMTGVSRSALLASTAMRGLAASTALVGGPFGLAAIAIGYVVYELVAAKKEADEFGAAMEESAKLLSEFEGAANGAANGSKAFGSESAAAVTGVNQLCDATKNLAGETLELADARLQDARAARLQQIEANRALAQKLREPSILQRGLGAAANLNILPGGMSAGVRSAMSAGELAADRLDATNAALMSQAIDLSLAPGAKWKMAGGRDSGGGGSGSDTKTSGGRTSTASGPTDADRDRNREEISRRLEREIEEIEARRIGTSEARHQLALKRLDWERIDADRALDLQASENQITKETAAEAKLVNRRVYDLGVQVQNGERAREVEEERITALREQADHESVIARMMDDVARNRAEMADTVAERNQIERQAFDAYQAAEAAAMEARHEEARARERLTGAIDAEAERRRQAEKNAFGAVQQSEEERFGEGQRRSNPLYRHVEAAKDVNNQVLEALSNGLGDFEDGLVNAIMETKNLGDVFANVAKGIIADLIRIQVRKSIIGPLANMLMGGFPLPGAPAVGGDNGGLLPGRLLRNAIGTNFSRGGLTLVGEGGPELVNMPKGSQVFAANDTKKMLAGNRQIAANQNSFHFTTNVYADDALMVGQLERRIERGNIETVEASRKLISDQMYEGNRRPTRR